jgi:hypothetical protein
MDLQQLKEQVADIGLVGERKAIALLCLGFYTTLFAINALFAPVPELTPLFAGLALCWGLAFFAVAADWFWGRWFAVGLGNFGWTTAAWLMLKTGFNTPLLVFGAMHAVVSLCLLGNRMADVYEARPDWRTRWQLDDQGVVKVRRAVTWAATSLPVIIMMALGPRGEGESVLVLAAIGLFGLLRGRTWGVMALTGAGVIALVQCALIPAGHAVVLPLMGEPVIAGGTVSVPMAVTISTATLSFVAGSLLLSAVVPFFAPVRNYLQKRN